MLLQRRSDKTEEEGMRAVRTALEFGMILNTYIKIVFGYLNRFNDIIVGGRSAYAKPRVGQKVSEIVVKLISRYISFK